MRESSSFNRFAERTVIVLLLVLLPLLSPLLDLWTGEGAYWFSPYIIWGAMIVAAYLLQRHMSKNAV